MASRKPKSANWGGALKPGEVFDPGAAGRAGKAEPLTDYSRRRDFEKTPEPAGGKKKPATYPIFVVQKHDASRLHYDFRLEVDGVLVSWAVPKGPSSDPAEKHLAVMTEDHPMEYADFEGVIPEGEYGGGTVMVWDRGVYVNLRAAPEKTRPTSMAASLAEGKVEVWLEGTKLRGGYVIIHTRGGADKNWLLFKMKDKLAGQGPDERNDATQSALTGRTLQEIATDGGGKVKHHDSPGTGKKAASGGMKMAEVGGDNDGGSDGKTRITSRKSARAKPAAPRQGSDPTTGKARGLTGPTDPEHEEDRQDAALKNGRGSGAAKRIKQ